MTIQQLEDQKKTIEAERHRLGGDGHSTIHLDNRVHDIENQIEALRSEPQANQQHGPSDKQITAKQRELNATTEKTLGGITFHHSRREAETELLLSTNSHAKKIERTAVEGQGESRADEIRALAQASGKSVQPKASIAQWAQAYEAKRNPDLSVSYHREGQERFVDRGATIGLSKANDDRSIKDAVELAREKWGPAVVVNVADHQKRDLIFKAMAQQNVKLGNNDPALQKRFAEISKEVQRQKIDAQLARPQRVEEHREQKQGQAIAQ